MYPWVGASPREAGREAGGNCGRVDAQTWMGGVQLSLSGSRKKLPVRGIHAGTRQSVNPFTRHFAY